MNVILFFILIGLFVVLTPGTFFTLPPKCGKWAVLFTHGFIFAVVWTIAYKFLGRVTSNIVPSIRIFEGMTHPATEPKKHMPKA